MSEGVGWEALAHAAARSPSTRPDGRVCPRAEPLAGSQRRMVRGVASDVASVAFGEGAGELRA